MNTRATSRCLPLILCVASMLHVVANAQSQSPVSEQETATPQRDLVEKIIRQRFPELDQDELAGWVDAYADLPLAELNQLLDQKSRMPKLAPDGFLQLPLSAEAEHAADILAVFEAVLLQQQRIHRHNLLHINTPGHRRQRVLTSMLTYRAETPASAVQLAAPTFDFSPVKTVKTDNPLHVALNSARERNVMFRSEPGCILTRCGAFERLNNGRLGLHCGEQSLALFGPITLPEDASDVQFEKSGAVSCRRRSTEKSAGARVQVGRLQVAVIDDMSLLTSRNGVFFTLPPDKIDEHVTMTSNFEFLTHALELSNIDANAELQALERLQRMLP